MKTFEQRLREESEDWVREGLITTLQRSDVLARHPVQSTSNRFLAMLALVGGALLVVGVSLIVKANWAAIPDGVKIGGLIALLLGAHAAGWRLKCAPGNHPRLGDAFFMAGGVLLLLGIALVSQVYHLDSRPPAGVLAWWLGIVALPWLVRSKALQFVSIIAGLAWLFMEFHASDSWIRLLPAASRWYDWAFMADGAAAFLLGAGLLGFGVGSRGGSYGLFAAMHERVGLLLATAGLYIMGFGWSRHLVYGENVQAARPAAIALLGAIAIAGTAWGWRLSRGSARTLYWALGLAALPVVAVLVGANLQDANWLWGGLACVTLFVLNVAMVRAGMLEGRESWINIGIAGIALNILTRYFVLFGTLLEGGVFFVVSGALVLALGYLLERQRRRFVEAARREVAS